MGGKLDNMREITSTAIEEQSIETAGESWNEKTQLINRSTSRKLSLHFNLHKFVA